MTHAIPDIHIGRVYDQRAPECERGEDLRLFLQVLRLGRGPFQRPPAAVGLRGAPVDHGGGA